MSKYKQGDVLAIVYDVWISGTKLGLEKKQCINSIEIKETVEGSDVATLQITDPEFLYIEDNIFLEDNTIKIRLGWDNTTHREEFEGYISAIDINFDDTGCPKLTVTCMDNTHIMNRKRKNNTFKDCTSADVVKKIVQSYGYTCVIDPKYKFTKQETITQSNQTDIDFITKLAGDEVHPFTARLVGKKFYYVKMGELSASKMTLTYRKYPHEIISFSPKINKEYKQVEVSSSKINTSNKEVSSTTGTVPSGSGSSSEEGKASGGYTYDPKTGEWTKSTVVEEDTSTSNETSKEDNLTSNSTDKDSSSGETEKKFNEIEINTLSGTLSFIVTEETIKLKAGDTVKLSGLGKYLSGKYYVKDITRQISESGYNHSATLIKTDFGKSLKVSGSTTSKKDTKNVPSTQEADSAKRTHTVKKGECLWGIAKQYYGDGSKYTKIFDANTDKVANPNLIYIGQVLVIP